MSARAVKSYPLASVEYVRNHLPDAIEYGVSTVARERGFTKLYLEYGRSMFYMQSDQPGINWLKKRNLFIARMLPAYQEKPTLRRKLALIMWAYPI